MLACTYAIEEGITSVIHWCLLRVDVTVLTWLETTLQELGCIRNQRNTRVITNRLTVRIDFPTKRGCIRFLDHPCTGVLVNRILQHNRCIRALELLVVTCE